MATSPSLTINSISNAIITDTNESVSMGKISWSIAAQADSDFAATKANYFADTSGWSNRYYWSSKSGSTSFNGLKSSVIVSETVSYTEKFIVSTLGKQVGIYATEPEAKTLVDSVPGNASYYYSYSIIQGAYYVYQYDLTIDKSTTSYTVSETVDVSNYITVQGTTPPALSPSYDISYTDTTVTANISNLISEQKVIFQVLQTLSAAGGIVVGQNSNTATESSMSLTVSGLTPSTEYTARVSVAGTYIGDKSFTTLSASSNPTYETSFNNNQITVTVSNISVGETAQLYIREPDDTTGSLPSYVAKSYKRESLADSSSVTWTETVEYNVKYIYSIVIQPNNVYLVNGETFTLGGEFQWTTDIYQWAKMASWQHPASGHTHPAPVTAEEWNRLVEIVNAKCGTNINKVSTSTPMRAGPGGNIRQVADALGVEVDKGYKITAKFFLDLQEAVNNIK